eukprot:gnl/MRDRNA2_/MRDRNA2_99581_c0_seq1.p1 gnl/MRDRNA2_/MRDRNA2_99581_c0~~gnl/MRDRNA2_/MRDRNA2_99581_c0_seq1.p1  ORF type:complete len:167 (+),score=28.02 gnl/MRDRNA2_/MRDRNA2_99581_c0_seq1:67-501(+)
MTPSRACLAGQCLERTISSLVGEKRFPDTRTADGEDVDVQRELFQAFDEAFWDELEQLPDFWQLEAKGKLAGCKVGVDDETEFSLREARISGRGRKRGERAYSILGSQKSVSASVAFHHIENLKVVGKTPVRVSRGKRQKPSND